MTPIIIVAVVVMGLMLAYLILHRRDQKKYLAAAEYWVYLPGDQMPSQEAMLTRMVGKNPYGQRGRTPIGPAEGIILSDIRLHIALILRKKNPHVFRPDLFDNVELTAEQISQLAASNSIVKIRYVSDIPLKDKRHLQFLIHAADAMATIGNSKLVYDSTSQRIFNKEELEKELSRSVDATLSALHVRALWNQISGGYRAETLGLKKIGVEELRTGPMEPDEQVLITQVLDLAVEEIWKVGAIPEEVEVDAFDDKFKLIFTKAKDGFADTRIMRIHAV